MKKSEKEEPPKSHRRILMLISIIILIILILLFGTKIYLWINLLLGNDLIIRLIPDKENVFLVNGQSEKINFELSVLTGPFCNVACDFDFSDLSEKKMIEEGNFDIKPAFTKLKTYSISAPLTGTGQKIFRFDIYCQSKKSFFCSTEGYAQSKSSLITLNYELDDNALKIKNSTKERIFNLMQKSGQISNDLESLNEAFFILKNYLEINFSEDIGIIKNSADNFNRSLIFLKESWEKGDLSLINNLLIEKETSFSEINRSFYSINRSISLNILVYNSLIDTLNGTERRLRDYQKLNFTNETLVRFDKLVDNFNYLIENFNKSETIVEKENAVNNIKNETDEIFIDIEQSQNESLSYKSYKEIDSLKLNPIIFIRKEFLLNLSLKEPPPQCCLFGKCKSCCDDSGYYDRTKFPVIFLHGHDFSKQASAESNMNRFYKIQRNLENEGYLDAGTMLLSSSSKEEEKGILGKTFYPISIKASYYFDIFKTQESTTVLQTKKDNIDSYAIRLRDIITEVKYKTDRQKVIIVAYSMGGLVARRYLQIFGENEVEKLIMIGTPNHGVGGNVLALCSVFGEESECNDLNENSLFINKLNRGENPSIPVYNIIGLGCGMDGEDGDGVVKNSSAYLSYAENYFVQGKCESINLFHNELLLPEKYPEIYNLLVKSLKQNSSINL
ncbi:MAG: alpha/beta hydrolase [Candidatus Nanoarchaeia archaeon]|nr:alpha/beta hydrolase [Candidatus Nanoarchaeia archaeon]